MAKRDEEKEELKREIGVVGLGANMINSIVGGGIFVLPAIVAAELGPASILAYLTCGFLILCIVLCFAEVGSKFTISGGAYAYVEAAFGKFAGFLTNNLFWFGFGIISDAAIANAMADMLAFEFSWLNDKIFRAIFFIMMFTVLALINIRGIKQGVAMVKFNTLAKMIPLMVLIIVGLFCISPENMKITELPAVRDLGDVSLVLFFAFAGGEVALSASGEIANPKRTIPLGILWGIIIVIVLYILIQTVTQGVMGNELSVNENAPLAATAKKIMGNPGMILITVGAVISIFGTLSGDILGYPRLLYSGARRGLYPGFLSRVDRRFSTPVYAIVVYTVIVVLFSVAGGFRQLAVLSSASLLLVYLGVVASTIKLRLKPGIYSEKNSFRIPGGLSIPIIALMAIIWFLTNISRQEAFGIILFLLLLSVIYLILSKSKNKIEK